MKFRIRQGLLWPLLLASVALVSCDASSGSDKATSQPLASEAKMQHNAEVVMYKSPKCDCCTDWANHLRQAGFTVVEHQRDDMDIIKAKHGVTPKLASCHTAIVDGYVIEGHVPATDVSRLLKERPDVIGLTAPGMPMKSPGMQKPHLIPKNYDVLAFGKDGKSSLFHSY